MSNNELNNASSELGLKTIQNQQYDAERSR